MLNLRCWMIPFLVVAHGSCWSKAALSPSLPGSIYITWNICVLRERIDANKNPSGMPSGKSLAPDMEKGARVVESYDEAAQHVTESFFFQEMLERAISPSHALPKDLSFARHGMVFGFFLNYGTLGY